MALFTKEYLKSAQKRAIVLGSTKISQPESFVMAQLIKNVYKNGEWPKYLIEFTLSDLMENTKATKFKDHRTCSKMVARLLRREF